MSDIRTFLWTILIFCILSPKSCVIKRQKKFQRIYTKVPPITTTVCLSLDQTLKARHKSCFLRPDTGPCRADILQWYYDLRLNMCFRFYWGGCQGNGNRFEKKYDCMQYCSLNSSSPTLNIPHYCSLTFDYGTCFGYFNRWAWDPLHKVCKRRLYSGCGGNQNNFESEKECLKTCLYPPYQSINKSLQATTCIPVEIPSIMLQY